MLSVRGIFNGKTVELLEEVPYRNEVAVMVTFLEGESVSKQLDRSEAEGESGISEREKLNRRLAEECRQLAAMNFDDIGTDEEWTRVQNEILFALEEERAGEENNGNSTSDKMSIVDIMLKNW